jgi:DNA-binding transcriptional MerR regulator
MSDPLPPLVGTAAAAKSLGITARTLQRYVVDGLIEPELTLPSGQYRWDPVKLRAQIKALAAKRTED